MPVKEEGTNQEGSKNIQRAAVDRLDSECRPRAAALQDYSLNIYFLPHELVIKK